MKLGCSIRIFGDPNYLEIHVTVVCRQLLLGAGCGEEGGTGNWRCVAVGRRRLEDWEAPLLPGGPNWQVKWTVANPPSA